MTPEELAEEQKARTASWRRLRRLTDRALKEHEACDPPCTDCAVIRRLDRQLGTRPPVVREPTIKERAAAYAAAFPEGTR